MTFDGSSRERSDGIIVAPLFHSVRLPCKAMPRCHGVTAPVLLVHFLSVNNL